MSTLTLLPHRETALLRKHPWIFSGAVDKVQGTPNAGDTVEVVSASGKWIAQAAYSPKSQIRARVWTFDKNESVGKDFFHQKITAAIAWREKYFSKNSAQRLVYGESDGLPGLIADRYGDFVVVQFLSTGAERWRKEIISAISVITRCKGIYERSDSAVREKEGLPLKTGLVAGEEPPEFIEIEENGSRFFVDIRNGHKTGFYLDQCDNRALLSQHVRGATVLNCFSYTGGFSVAALKGGASHVTNIDSSEDVLQLAEKNLKINEFENSLFENITGDVFLQLRQFRDKGASFDCVILDPPKFIDSARNLDKGARGYKDINLLAMKIIKPGGLLFSFSCSGLLDAALFQKIIADAAIDAGREALMAQYLTQSPDHPVLLSFPEAAYLKGLMCIVL